MKNKIFRPAFLFLALVLIAIGMLTYIHPAVNYALLIVGALCLVVLVVSMNGDKAEEGRAAGPLLAELALLVALLVAYFGGFYLVRWTLDSDKGILMAGIALLLMLVCVCGSAIMRWRSSCERP